MEIENKQPEIQQEADSSSLRDQIESAFKEVAERQTETAEEKDARLRDGRGRFAAKSDEPKALEKAEAKEQIQKPEAREATKEPAEPKEVRVLKAPDSWSPAAKEKFAELPAEVQTEISKREAEVHKGITKQDEERQFGKQLRDVIIPYQPVIQALGGNAAEIVRDGMQALWTLNQGTPAQKATLISNLAAQYGVDLTTVAPEPSNEDPTISGLKKELAELRSYLGSRQQAEQHQQIHSLQQTIGAFASDPAQTHYETVKADMAALLIQGRAADLKDAYEKACWANPEVRSSLISEQLRSEQDKRAAELKQTEAKKKAAAVSVTGSPGIGAPSNPQVPDRSLRDELVAQYQAVVGGRI